MQLVNKNTMSFFPKKKKKRKEKKTPLFNLEEDLMMEE